MSAFSVNKNYKKLYNNPPDNQEENWTTGPFGRYSYSFSLMPESRQSQDEVCSEAANRLLAMTRDVEQHFQHINKYKRARE